MKADIEIIQQKTLNILKEFIKICDKHNLTYYAVGGTLLGAIRHQGFIPWDDDIDMAMPREDYEKLKGIVQKELASPYLYLSEDSEGYGKAFAVIRDTSTKIIMSYSNVKQEESLWIDIFPIDGLPKHPIKKKFQEYRYLYRRMIVQLSQFDKIVNQNKKNRPFHEKVIMSLAKVLPLENMLDFEKAHKRYILTIRKYDMSEAYSGNYTGAYKLRELVPTSYFGKPTAYPFEDIFLNGPEKAKEYLIAIYGENYMQLPPEEQRLAHQYEIVSLGDLDEN